MQTGQYSQGSWDIKTLTNLATLFSQVGFNVGKKVWPFPHQKPWVQGRLHFLRDSFGGVAPTFRKFVGISP